MIIKSYNTLTEAYLGINNSLYLEGGIGTPILGMNLCPPPLVLSIDQARWEIPLELLGYSPSKMKQLMRNYLDMEKFLDFRDNPKGDRRPREQSYQFEKKPRGKNCLLQISYNRIDDSYTVVWRTTELGQRWGADLKLISNLIPGEKVNLVIPFSYQDVAIWGGISEMLKIKIPKMKKENKKYYDWARSKYYPPNLSTKNLSTRSPVKRVQSMVIKFRLGELNYELS